MAEAATPTKADLHKRQEIAERLVRREAEVAELLRLIAEDKDELRALSIKAGEGFALEVKGLGSVEVRAGRAKELTGTSPELVVSAYLALTEGRRKKLVEDGLVKIVEVWKSAAKPTVTVRL